MLWLLLVAWLALVAGWVAMLVDAASRPRWAFERAERGQGPTVALVFFAGWVGAAYYFFVIRPSLIEGQARGATRPTRSDDDNWTPPAR